MVDILTPRRRTLIQVIYNIELLTVYIIYYV